MEDHRYIRKLKKIITNQYKHIESMQQQICIDKLTGAYSRQFGEKVLDTKLDEYKRYGYKFKLLYVDINGFKNINDAHGHRIGDIVLKIFVKIVRQFIRKSDCIIRMGGDEFIIVLNNYTSDISEKIKFFKDRLIKRNINIAVGSVDSSDADTIEKLMLIADERMYIDKNLFYGFEQPDSNKGI